jgi:hypothetical protein
MFQLIWPSGFRGDFLKLANQKQELSVDGILIGHGLSMRILYRFHGWLIFARVIALFIFPYELML